ncbi:unnamed protein product [Bathycoccus prasinos]
MRSSCRRRQSSVISKRMTLAMTMMIVALFLSPGVFSADAIKHQHSKTKSAGEASPTPVETEETTTTKEHLLDPALNTDEVRDAAKQVGHITDMDAYLAAIEHKMDVLAEHPAHNVEDYPETEQLVMHYQAMHPDRELTTEQLKDRTLHPGEVPLARGPEEGNREGKVKGGEASADED